MSKKKKVTAPLSYDPGKGRPKEYLAYLNWQEMQALQRLNGGNMERGPMGLPSFPPDWKGSDTSTGNWSGAGGSTTGAGTGGGSDSGGSDSGGSVGGTTSPGATASTTGTTDGTQSSDTAAQQAAATQNAAAAAKTSALAEDARKGGIASINVGPMQAPVQIGGGQIFGSISGIAQQGVSPALTAPDVYRPSSISPGGLATPGSIPISRAMNFSQSLPGIRQPDMAESVKQAALTNKSLFSVKNATPQQQALVDRIAPTVLQESITTGLDPRTILGQALTESTTAKNQTKVSKLARDANNLFGVKATGQPNQFWSGESVNMPTKEVINGKEITVSEPFRKYDTPEQAVMDYSRLMQTERYKNAAQFSTPEQQLSAIRGGGYATHPAKSYVGLGVKNIARISPGVDSSTTATASIPASQSSAYSVAMMDPVAAATLSGIARLPSALSNFKIPAIPEASQAQKNALAAAKMMMPAGMYQNMINKAVADATSGFSLRDTVAGAFGAMNEAMNKPQTAVAENEIQNVEEQYRRSPGVAASVIPSKFNYPVKPDGTPYTAEDIANLPPEIQKAHYEALMAERMGRVPYNLTQEQREKIAVAKGIGRVVNANPITRAFVAGSRVLGGGLGLLPGAAGEFGEGLAEAGRQIGRPGDAVEDYVTSSPLKQVQMEVLAGKPNRIPGTAPVYSGSQYAGGIPTQEPGGKGNDFGSYVREASYTPPAGPTSAAEEMGRPAQYYLWDLGVGIPSPGDPDYNEYQKYRRNRGSSTDV